jgi:hypothetical protein
MILAAAEAEYFLRRGWTVVLLFCPSGRFVDVVAEFYARHFSAARRKLSSINGNSAQIPR